jgi:hypothetical protein
MLFCGWWFDAAAGVREEEETITENGDWTICTAFKMFRGEEACFCIVANP